MIRRGPLSIRSVAIDGDEPEVAYVLTKRVGNAVVRNRVRRRLRVLVAQRQASFDNGFAYLIGAGPSAATASFRSLGSHLDAVLTEVRP